ncbi:MAG TPA: hypothetical protein VMU60_06560 [Syntrophobacteria bacterium]|nr:hypothetical protein [Syntrophobacteria bacterium]
MKKTLILLLLCLALLSGCYVHTQVEAQGGRLPADLSAAVVVVDLRDRVGLTEAQAADLEREAVQTLISRGVPSVSVAEAAGGPAPKDLRDLLRRRDYSTLLQIFVTSWGSKVEVLSTSAGPSVGTLQTGPDTSFYRPGSIEESEYRGPVTTYKEVAITASLLDLRDDHTLWSAEVSSRPVVSGRSCLYHAFNRSLQLDDLARRCFTRLAEEFPRYPAATSY